jgi:hypothetical protein
VSKSLTVYGPQPPTLTEVSDAHADWLAAVDEADAHPGDKLAQLEADVALEGAASAIQVYMDQCHSAALAEDTARQPQAVAGRVDLTMAELAEPEAGA